jgi:hypothetical protein
MGFTVTKKVFTTAQGVVQMSDTKKCSKCHKSKIIHMDFYMCQGSYRSECKMCTIKKNVAHQKKTKSWRHRFVDSDEKRLYSVDYYAKNKDKFAEYRRKFKERYPNYHKEYNQRRKMEKLEKEEARGKRASPKRGLKQIVPTTKEVLHD